MRIGTAQPKTERLALGLVPIERFEAVDFHAGGILFGLSTVDPARWRLELARRPGFAVRTDRVTCCFQHSRISGEPAGQTAMDIAGFLQTPDMLPGQNGTA